MQRDQVCGTLATLSLVLAACGGPGATGTATPAAGTASPAAATATPGATVTPAATATATAASGSATPAATPIGMPTSIGAGEGSLTVLNWPGYLENGGTDPTVDWVTPFQTATGCQVEFTPFGTSDAAFSLFTTNPEQFDVISASGDASLRLVRAGYVQPINVDLVPNYADIYTSIKDQPYNTVDGVHYGIPHGRGSNQLMWRTDQVTPAPTAWSQMFAANSGYKVSVYDAPIYIADAAVVLMHDKPDLGITNPYALDETQFAAAIALLQQQRPTIAQYWTDYVDQMDKFRNGDVNVGTTWQVIANLLQGEDPAVPVDLIKPVEGATGWSDTWMVNSKTKHINCAYKFLDYIVSPAVNIQIAEWFGEAPSNSKACALAVNPEHCNIFHAADNDPFWSDVWYWQTPEAACVDGRTDVQCKSFDDWVDAWTTLKG
jgi:putative spermidine/putrescine transport system substrate-binding protein